MSEHEVAAQQSVSLDCQAEGNPQPAYSWTPCDPQQSVCQKSVLHFQASDNSVYAFTCKVENYLGSDARNTFICKNTITSINYLHTNGFLFVMIISFKENSGSRTFCLYHHVLSTRFLWPFVFVTYTYSAQSVFDSYNS